MAPAGIVATWQPIELLLIRPELHWARWVVPLPLAQPRACLQDAVPLSLLSQRVAVGLLPALAAEPLVASSLGGRHQNFTRTAGSFWRRMPSWACGPDARTESYAEPFVPLRYVSTRTRRSPVSRAHTTASSDFPRQWPKYASRAVPRRAAGDGLATFKLPCAAVFGRTFKAEVSLK